MKWIDVNEKHFVEITKEETADGTKYAWEEKDCCPDKAFLVGCSHINNKTKQTLFDYELVVLTEFGLQDLNGDSSEIDILDVTHWCEIEQLI